MADPDSGRPTAEGIQAAQRSSGGQTGTEQATNVETVQTLLNKLTINPSLLTVQESRVLQESNLLPRTKYYKLGPGEFRILAIYPGEGDDILRCRIFPQSLDNIEKPYAALSYTWGDLKDTTWLLCLSADPNPASSSTGQSNTTTGTIPSSGLPELGRVRVTRNLITALKHLRLKNSTISMWVDAVCINQEDVQERDRQLPLMAEIYNKATVTDIWLGEASDTSDYGMDLIQKTFVAPVIDPVSGIKAIITPFEDDTPITYQKEWEGLRDILHRPWFQRVWVRQEVAFSINPIILCGTKSMSWRVFEAATTSILKMNATFADTLDPLHGLHHTGVMNFLRIVATNENSENPDMGLVDEPLVILSMCRECKASVSKDKVLAVIGLCSVTPRKFLNRLGFSSTAEQVFERVSIVSLMLYNSLKFLSHAGMMNSEQKSELTLPSWIPDWSIPCPVNVIDTAYPNHQYRACGNTKPKFKYDIKQRHLLTLTGRIIDKIESITDKTPNFSYLFHSTTIFTADDKQYAIYNWAKQIESLTSKHEFSPISLSSNTKTTATTKEEALWRTLIADKRKPYTTPFDPSSSSQSSPSPTSPTTNRHRAPSSYQQSYKSWTYLNLHHDPLSMASISPASPDKFTAEQQSYDFQTAMYRVMRGRKFGVTSKYFFFVVGAERMRVGDLVCVFWGGGVPFILREVVGDDGVEDEDDGNGNGIGTEEDKGGERMETRKEKEKDKRYKLVSECYVYGLMDGEAFNSDGHWGEDNGQGLEDVEFVIE